MIHGYCTAQCVAIVGTLFFSGVGAKADKGIKPGKGRMWLANPRCEGYETRLSKCDFYGWTGSGCTHKQDVGVICRM